jgi:hypothetical protein
MAITAARGFKHVVVAAIILDYPWSLFRRTEGSNLAPSSGESVANPSRAPSARGHAVPGGRARGRSSSRWTRRWRETDSNPRSPAYGELGVPGRAREFRLCVVMERHLSRYDGRCRPPPYRDLAHPEAWRALPGTMLSKRDAQFGRGPPVAPDTFIRGSDAPALLLRLSRSWRALCWLRASVAYPGGAASSWLLALAHPRRTAVNGDGRAGATAGRRAGATGQNLLRVEATWHRIIDAVRQLRTQRPPDRYTIPGLSSGPRNHAARF